MNRPLRITLIGGIGTLVIAALQGFAMGQDSPAKRLRNSFENCAYDAATTEFVHQKTVDGNAAAEVAFYNCQTEERAIAAYLRAIGVNPEVPVVTMRLRIKAGIRDMAASLQKLEQPKR